MANDRRSFIKLLAGAAAAKASGIGFDPAQAALDDAGIQVTHCCFRDIGDLARDQWSHRWTVKIDESHILVAQAIFESKKVDDPRLTAACFESLDHQDTHFNSWLNRKFPEAA